MISFLILFLTIIVKTNKITVNNNLQKNRVKRNVQIDTYFDTNIVIETMAPIFYIINVTDYYFHNDGLDLFIFSNPELNEDITLLITLYIDIFNDSLGYWTNKEIDVRAYDYYGTRERFSAYIDDLNLDNLNLVSLTVLNIIVESNSTNNNYNVYFEEINYSVQEETSVYDSAISNYYETDTDSYNPDTTDDTEFSNISGGSKSSGSISTGVIIGIIIAVVVVIGGIITTYCLCKNKKNETNGSETEIKIKNTNESVLNQINKNITFSFKTGNQQIQTELTVKDNITLLEMRIQYFKKINKINLVKNKQIFFLCDAKCFAFNSEGLIKDHFKDENKVYQIIVVDQNQEEKMVLETPQNSG